MQTASERRTDLILASEPYVVPNKTNWFGDTLGVAAIGILNQGSVSAIEREAGFVGVCWNGTFVYSCYISPNSSFIDFSDFVNRLVVSLSFKKGCPIIVAGDFNAASYSWNGCRTDRRGRYLESAFEEAGLFLQNNGYEFTFVRRSQGSVLDLTFTSSDIAGLVENWKVLSDVESSSDHLYIEYVIKGKHDRLTYRDRKRKGWRTKNLDEDLLEASWHLMNMTQPTYPTASCDDTTANLTNMVKFACDTCLKPYGKPDKYKPVYWWTEDIANLRRECIRRRREASRLGHDSYLYEEAQDAYREARRSLRKEIRISKSQSWIKLCDEVNENPWGRPYKIVMGKFKGPSATTMMESECVNNIVNTLFPTQPGLSMAWALPADCPIFPEITYNEVSDILATDKGKTPGPDGIPKKIWRLINKWDQDILPSLFNKCLYDGVFPRLWKEADLTLIRKPGKPAESPSSFRPLCLLNDAGKLLETIISQRIVDYLTSENILSPKQHGFTKGRSTITALQRLVEIVTSAKENRQLCLAISLDVKNAFNTVRWKDVLSAVIRRGVPPYLIQMVSSYFKDRWITAESATTTLRWAMSGGVPQGSVIGPLLWNIAFDDLLQKAMPNGVELICYADDTLITVCADSTSQLELSSEAALNLVSDWMATMGLELAIDKTEMLFFKGRRRHVTPPAINFHGTILPINPTMTYLGVLLDSRLSFNQHFQMVRDKSTAAATHLARIMPNIGGPASGKRLLLMNVVTSILTYASPIWESRLQVKRNRALLTAAHRKAAQRCISSYRTVSYVAATALSGIPPIDLLLRERQKIKNLLEAGQSELSAKNTARSETIELWQERWRMSEPQNQGEWTKKLIPQLDEWVMRSHGHLTFRLTQLLTGHGCFQSYLQRFRLASSPICLHCNLQAEDTADHTLFHCPAWQPQRSQLQSILGPLNSSEMTFRMILNPTCWSAVISFAERVMKEKEQAERNRQRGPLVIVAVPDED